jgi:hypothetical protein
MIVHRLIFLESLEDHQNYGPLPFYGQSCRSIVQAPRSSSKMIKEKEEEDQRRRIK